MNLPATGRIAVYPSPNEPFLVHDYPIRPPNAIIPIEIINAVMIARVLFPLIESNEILMFSFIFNLLPVCFQRK